MNLEGVKGSPLGGRKVLLCRSGKEVLIATRRRQNNNNNSNSNTFLEKIRNKRVPQSAASFTFYSVSKTAMQTSCF